MATLFDDFGGSVSVSGDGTTALTGAQFDDDPNGNFAGSACIFILGDGAESTTTVAINLDSALTGQQPAGLRKYNVSADGPAESSITTVTPGVITGDPFQIVSGGEGTAAVTARAADFGDQVQQGSPGSVNLFEVTFTGTVTRSDLTVDSSTLTNDNGEAIPERRLSVTVETDENPFSAAIGTGEGPPTDPDDDGTYEDVDGGGDVDFDDAVEHAFTRSDELTAAQREALDIDDDGEFTFADAIELAFQS